MDCKIGEAGKNDFVSEVGRVLCSVFVLERNLDLTLGQIYL